MRALIGGLVAGIVGTLAMDLVWYLRYRRGGGESSFLAWEVPTSVESWDKASAPARVGKLLYEAATQRELSAQYAALTTNVMHWGYGVTWGVLYVLSVGSTNRARLRQGPLLGFLVWLSSYVTLPIAGSYKPMWEYDLKTLWDDLSAHLVYGTAIVTAAKVNRPGCSSQ